MPCHTLQDEEIETDRRRDLRHLDHDHQVNAEPDDVESSGADHGFDHRHGQHYGRDPVKETTENDVEDGQRNDQGQRRKLQLDDPGGEITRQPGKAHGKRQEGGAGQDQRDHGGGYGRTQEALFERRPAERFLSRGDYQRTHHAQDSRLSRCRNAKVDRAEHGHDQQHHRNELQGLAHPLGDGDTLVVLRHLLAVHQGPGADIAHEKHRKHDPRQHPRHEKLIDGLVHRDAVDDQDDGGRDEQTQGASAGQRADDNALGVLPAAQLGDRHLADGDNGRGARARDCGEDRTADDIHVKQAPGEPAHPWRKATEEVLREPGAE